VLERLAEDLLRAERAVQAAHETATHEENIAENKHDTLGFEASYLATGQARRAEAIHRVPLISIDDLEDLTRLRLRIEVDALRQSIRSGDAAWREHLRMAFDELSALVQAVRPAQRRQWEQLHAHCHEALIGVGTLPWTVKVQRMLWRHSERYR